MDPQRHSQRVRVGMIVIATIFVFMGFLPAAEWLSGVIGLVR